MQMWGRPKGSAPGPAGLGQALALPSGCEAYSRGRRISSRAYGLLSVVERNSRTFGAGACSTV